MSDFRHLTTRNGGHTWYCVQGVPRKLKPIVGKHHLLESLHTRDLVVAQRKRWPVLAKFQAIFDAAQKQVGAGEVMGAAAQGREHFARLRSGDLTHVWDSRYPEGGEPLKRAALAQATQFVEDDAAEVAGTYGPETATAFLGVATGRATPLLHAVEDALLEGGTHGPLNLRTQSQIRSAIMRFASWCERNHVPPVVEAVTGIIAGRYATEGILQTPDPLPANPTCTRRPSYHTVRALIRQLDTGRT